MRGHRGYRRFIGVRGGYSAPFKPWNRNQGYKVWDNTPIQPNGEWRVNRPTGGRTTGRHNWADPSYKHIGGRRSSSYKTDKDKVKDEPVFVGPISGGGNSYEKPYNTPVTVNFGINRQRVRVTAAGSTYSYSTLFSPRRISKTKQARSLNRNVPTQSAEYFKTGRTECGCGQQTSFNYTWLTCGTMDSFCANSDTVLGAKTADVWLRRSQLTMTMTNNTNGNIFCEIWEGYYRRDCKDDIGLLWRQGLKDQGILGPTGLTSDPDALYMMDPLKSKLFCQYARVTNVTTLELGEGRGHQHRSRLYANLKYNNELQQESGPTVNYLGGISRFMMVISRGGPLNQSGTRTSVSSGQVGIDLIITTKHSYFYTTPQTYTMYTSGSFPTLSTPTVVNEDTGSPVTNQVW